MYVLQHYNLLTIKQKQLSIRSFALLATDLCLLNMTSCYFENKYMYIYGYQMNTRPQINN